MAEPADRRASERLAAGPGAACTFAGRVAEDLGQAKVRDVSMEGVGLLLAKRVEVGAVLVLGLTHPEKGFAKTVMVKVAHVTAVPGGFLVGGTLDAPLTYQELTTLVL
jgi:hypothetical protein